LKSATAGDLHRRPLTVGGDRPRAGDPAAHLAARLRRGGHDGGGAGVVRRSPGAGDRAPVRQSRGRLL